MGFPCCSEAEAMKSRDFFEMDLTEKTTVVHFDNMD